MNDKGDKLILLVGFKHDVRDGRGGASHGHLQVVKGLLVFLKLVYPLTK